MRTHVSRLSKRLFKGAALNCSRFNEEIFSDFKQGQNIIIKADLQHAFYRRYIANSLSFRIVIRQMNGIKYRELQGVKL